MSKPTTNETVEFDISYRSRITYGQPSELTTIDSIRYRTEHYGDLRILRKEVRDLLATNGIRTLGDLASRTRDEVSAIFNGRREKLVDNLEKMLSLIGNAYRTPEADIIVVVSVSGPLAVLATEAALGSDSSASDLLTGLIAANAESLSGGLQEQVNAAKLAKAAALQEQANVLIEQANALRAEVQQG